MWSRSLDMSSVHMILRALDPSSVVRATGTSPHFPSSAQHLRIGQPLHWRALFVVAQASLALPSRTDEEIRAIIEFLVTVQKN